MRNRLVVFLVAVFLVSGGWYVWRNKNFLSAPSKAGSGGQAVLPLPESGSVVASPDNSEEADLLKAKALEIISRPISVKIQISDSSKRNTLAKLDELIKLIKDKYDYVNAWYDLGAYRMVIGDYEGAIDAYKFIALINPGDYIGYVNLGDIYGGYLKNYLLAEENFLKAIHNNFAYVSGYTELAILYENNFNDGPKKAEDLLLSGIKSNPQDLYLKIKLAEFYKRNDRNLEALTLFREILSLDPNNKSVEVEVVRLSQ